MGLYLNSGNIGFESVRKDLYVDKSGMLSFINGTFGTKRKLICVSRPRRFGKTFAAQMICAYYDKTCDSRNLFEDLEISKDPSFEKHLNKYDVIYFDMNWFIANAGDLSNVVSDLNKELAAELHEAYPEAAAEKIFPKMLANAAKVTGNKFMIVIDEWDAMFRERKKDIKAQKEYLEFLRALFKSSLTDNIIQGAYMTGILPIKKYGTQSELTDFYEYTMLNPEPLEEYFGFTESEVKCLAESSELGFDMLEKWYDGYVMGDGIHIYNPKSVLEAIRLKRFGSYWSKTETYEALKFYIEMNFEGLKEDIVLMLGGASCKIDADSFRNDMVSIESKDDVLTLLVHLGYLAYSPKDETVRIPNEEIRREFVRAVKNGKYSELVKLIGNSELLLENTLDMDSKAVAKAVENAHNAGTAPTFYNNEQALRSVIKFAYICYVDKYLRIEELPSGRGYADVVYIPKNGSDLPVMVIELKWNKTAEAAIAQIKNRDYPQAIDNVNSDILLVGINYESKTKKHTCCIEMFKK